jgi:hypothetical protein
MKADCGPIDPVDILSSGLGCHVTEICRKDEDAGYNDITWLVIS